VEIYGSSANYHALYLGAFVVYRVRILSIAMAFENAQ
jgi:hypothetical protein